MAARQEPGLLYVRARTVFSCQRRVVSAVSEAWACDRPRCETADQSEEIKQALQHVQATAHTHTRAHARAPANTHTRTRTRTHTRTHAPAATHTHTHQRATTHTRTHTHEHAPTHTHPQQPRARTQKHTHRHTRKPTPRARTHAHTHAHPSEAKKAVAIMVIHVARLRPSYVSSQRCRMPPCGRRHCRSRWPASAGRRASLPWEWQRLPVVRCHGPQHRRSVRVAAVRGRPQAEGGGALRQKWSL
jgi:hypothetical protein